MPAATGSLLSGWISDRFFNSRRAPVAAGIYVIEVCVLLGATKIHTVNSTHSLLGPAAAMDIGGRKMAGFASGVIDSFQYFGAAVAIKMLGYILDRYGWGFYFYYICLLY